MELMVKMEEMQREMIFAKLIFISVTFKGHSFLLILIRTQNAQFIDNTSTQLKYHSGINTKEQKNTGVHF
jgi:hypothetical protein